MNLDHIFYNGPRIAEIFENGLQNTVFYSSPGTGKTTACVQIYEEYEGPKVFIPADTKFGKDQAVELSNSMEYQSEFLVVFDEGVNMTPDAQNTLRSLTNNPNYIFLICTNEIGKMSGILLDRFIRLDCNIPKNSMIKESMLFWLPDNLRTILEEENVDFSDVFDSRFKGSMRSFIRDIENRILDNPSEDLSPEFILEHYDENSIINHVFECWNKSQKCREHLKEITETVYKMTACSFKKPFLRYLLSIKEDMNVQV